jgi:hypothetical protein
MCLIEENKKKGKGELGVTIGIEFQMAKLLNISLV